MILLALENQTNQECLGIQAGQENLSLGLQDQVVQESLDVQVAPENLYHLLKKHVFFLHLL